MTGNKEVEALERIRKAIYIADGDTLTIAAGDRQTVWHSTGSWQSAEPVTLGDMRVLLERAAASDESTQYKAVLERIYEIVHRPIGWEISRMLIRQAVQDALGKD